jgi:ech hydrogenase subunit F
MSYFRMTALALKWAFKKPATRPYPFVPRQAIADSRGQLAFNPATCVFCSVCRKKCPTGAIGVNRHQKKWAIDRLRCISCGYCVEACPKDSLKLTTAHGVPVVTKDKEIYQAPPAPAATPAPAPVA